MSCKISSIIRVACRRSAAAGAALIVLFAGVVQPYCRAAVLEITSTVAISALIAYLGSSGISYVADGGDTSDIINSIQDQISPYIIQQYGSDQAWLNDIRSMSSPIGVLNGGLSISKPLCDMYADIRQWMVTDVFGSSSSVTVDHIAGVDSGVYSCTVNGSAYGTYAVTSSINEGSVRKSASWLGDGCYVQLPESFFSQNADTDIRLSSMPANQTLLFRIRTGGSYYTGQLIDASTGTQITSFSFPKRTYFFIGLGRDYNVNGVAQAGSYVLYLGSDNSATSSYLGVIGYQVPGSLSSVTTPSYTLTSDYDSSVSAPVVDDGRSLVVNVGADLIDGVDSQLEDVLTGVQAGDAVYPDSRVDADAANVAPAVYSAGTDYALDLTHYFPFCVPWDIDRGLRLFAADPVTPSISWTVPLPNGSSYTLELDLHDYDGIAAVARKLELILWVVGLAVATKYLIKW